MQARRRPVSASRARDDVPEAPSSTDTDDTRLPRIRDMVSAVEVLDATWETPHPCSSGVGGEALHAVADIGRQAREPKG